MEEYKVQGSKVSGFKFQVSSFKKPTAKVNSQGSKFKVNSQSQ